jgi:hypothetical protein
VLRKAFREKRPSGRAWRSAPYINSIHFQMPQDRRYKITGHARLMRPIPQARTEHDLGCMERGMHADRTRTVNLVAGHVRVPEGIQMVNNSRSSPPITQPRCPQFHGGCSLFSRKLLFFPHSNLTSTAVCKSNAKLIDFSLGQTRNTLDRTLDFLLKKPLSATPCSSQTVSQFQH